MLALPSPTDKTTPPPLTQPSKNLTFNAINQDDESQPQQEDDGNESSHLPSRDSTPVNARLRGRKTGPTFAVEVRVPRKRLAKTLAKSSRQPKPKRVRPAPCPIKSVWVISPTQGVTLDFILGGVGDIVKKRQDTGQNLDPAEVETFKAVVSTILSTGKKGEEDVDGELLLRQFPMLDELCKERLGLAPEQRETDNGKWCPLFFLS